MSIRKYKSKLALCIAALFWTACDNDSSTTPDVNTPPDSSETSKEGVSSSSEATASTENSSSSSPEYPYILAIHPSVHCKDSTFFLKATCENSASKKVSSDIISAAPLYGVPCIPEDITYSIFKCDDGSMFPGGNHSSLVGDTLVQMHQSCGVDSCGEWMRSDEWIAKMAEEAEANPESPYKLARDTTINCKQTFRPSLDKATSIFIGFEYESLYPEGCYKCDDGNIYERDDLLQDENHNLWEKEN